MFGRFSAPQSGIPEAMSTQILKAGANGPAERTRNINTLPLKMKQQIFRTWQLIRNKNKFNTESSLLLGHTTC